MSAAWLYGLARAPQDRLAAAIDGLSGVTGPVRADPAGTDVLLWGPSDGEEVQPTRRTMLAHTRVLEAAMRCGELLPMRFGMIAARLGDAIGLVTEARARIDAEFARVSGAVEMGLRVGFPREAALAATLAVDRDLAALRDRMRARGRPGYVDQIEFGRRVAEALDRRRGEAQRALTAALAPLVRAQVTRVPESDVEVLRAELLVPREAEERLPAAVAEAVAALSFVPGAEPSIRLVGPSPAFHFVTLALAPAPALEGS